MPGTAPQGWQDPKTSYSAEDVLTPEQFERIEGNIYAIEQGERTIDPSQAPTGLVGTLRQFLDWFANRIRAILGTTNWYDAPPTTLTETKSHIDAAAPHSGHETPTGAQAKVDAHAEATSVHSATSAATASRLMMRDAAGRAKVAAPAAADDIARKAEVDAAQSSLAAAMHATTGHTHTGATGDGPVLTAFMQPGDAYIIASSDKEYKGSDVAPSNRIKEITIGFSGAIRVSFELKADPSTVSYGQIYVNGVPVGQERSRSYDAAGYITFTEDITGLQPGDRVQLYHRKTGSNYGYARNFRLGVASCPAAITTYELTS